MPCRGGAISHNWVSSNLELEEAAACWSRVIGLDTEFQRTNTFFPLPGLYQVVSGADIYLIDPLTIDDWQPFVAALEDEDTTLIMHACGEDLELMFHHLGAIPTALFDTQVANAFVSTDFALSYTNLVRTHLGIELGKPQTRSDWRRRPLSDAQLHYACEDVTHLPELHRRLCDKLERLGRDEWYFETMAGQGRYVPSEPDRYYQTIRKAWRLSGDDLAVLKSLTSWRERTAMTVDVPRSRVVWDEHLLVFAQQKTLSADHVRELLPRGIARRYAEHIVAEHRGGRDSDPLPRLAAPLSQSQGEVSKKLREVARARAQGDQMAQELLARKRDVERCIRHYMETGELSADYSGWRDALVGESFRDILARLG